MAYPNEYKQAIKEDIIRLKHLDLDVLPAGTFYAGVAKMIAGLYAIIVGVPFLAMLTRAPARHLGYTFLYADLIYLSILFLMICAFVLPQMAGYITFKKTIKPHLKLGALTDAQFKWMFALFAITYSLWAVFYTLFLFSFDFQHLGERMFTVPVGFVFGIFVTATLVEMELARAGIATLFALVGSFRKDRKEN